MADSGARVPLSGLYMAPRTQYRKYKPRNPNAHTRHITLQMPHISHLASRKPPNLPYISEVADKQPQNSQHIGKMTALQAFHLSAPSAPANPTPSALSQLIAQPTQRPPADHDHLTASARLRLHPPTSAPTYRPGYLPACAPTPTPAPAYACARPAGSTRRTPAATPRRQSPNRAYPPKGTA